MKRNKLISLLLILVFTFSQFGSFITAKAGTIYLQIDKNFSRVIEAEPGTTIHVKMPLTAVSEYAYDTYAEVAYSNSDPFTASTVTLTQSDEEYDTITSYDYTYAEFDLSIKDNAKIGTYDLNVDFTFNIKTDDDIDDDYKRVKETHELSVKVLSEKDPAQFTLNDVTYNEKEAAVGSSFDVGFKIGNQGEIDALSTYYSIDYGSTDIAPDYSVEKIKLGTVKAGESKSVTVSMKALTTAGDGLKTLNVNFSYKDEDGITYTDSKKLYVTLEESGVASTSDASLVFGKNTLQEEVSPGDTFNLQGTIKNIGSRQAKNVTLKIEDGTGTTSQIMENFNSDSITLKNMEADTTQAFAIPLKVSKTAGPGLQKLSVQLEYKDSNGKKHTVLGKYYITILDSADESIDNDIKITNISQSPLNPGEGDVVNLTYNLENNGSESITNAEMTAENLSGSGLEPMTADPNVNLGTMAAGKSKNVTMQFKVGDNVSGGTKSIRLNCSYKDSNGRKKSFDTTVYLLGIVEKDDDNSKKPKVIVDSYTTDSEELKAGSKFLLSYGLKNTNTKKAAENVKVTISQDDNIFTVDKGNNIIYIDRINPGETVQNEISMEVDADAETGTYELNIDTEYEYEDMSDLDEDNGGVTQKNTILLKAMEDSQVLVDNISVGEWGEEPVVGRETSLGFEFYNMGLSALEDVYFTYEGDFNLESGNMTYLGTIDPGDSEYIESIVIPQVEGNAAGTIVIHYEDSVGNKFTKELAIPENTVLKESVSEDGDKGQAVPAVNTGSVQAQSNTLPVWLVIVLLLAELIIAIPIVRIIMVRIQKRKAGLNKK
ncbi:MAG: hypothetical protein WCD89_26915 [Anaerocolumna sp.]